MSLEVQDVSVPLAYVMNGSIVVLGLTLQSWSIIFGIFGMLGTFFVTWYFKAKEREDRLAEMARKAARGETCKE